jgi:hypothetical protein
LAPTPLPSPKSEYASQHKSSHSHQLWLPVHHLCDLVLRLAPRNLALWIRRERWMPRRLPLQVVLRSPPSSYRWQLLLQSGLWCIKCGNRCVHNCSSLMHTPNPNQKPNGWIQDSPPAAAYKVDTTWAFSLVPPTSPPQLAMKVSANGPQKLGAAMFPTPNNLCVVGSIEAHLHPGI